jgi:hypothetical protein
LKTCLVQLAFAVSRLHDGHRRGGRIHSLEQDDGVQPLKRRGSVVGGACTLRNAAVPGVMDSAG